MKNLKKIFIIFLVGLSLLWAKSNNETELTILFTNDTNGHPLSFTYMEQDGLGGIPARATLINRLIGGSKKKKNILILDAGEIIRGLPESNLYNGETDILGMNAAEYDIAGIGASEIWESKRAFDKLNKKADFYFICSNLKNKKNEYITDPYIVEKFGGFKGINVGIFSLITKDASGDISDEARKDFLFLDPVETAKSIVTELKSRKNKADIIIALTSLGYYPDNLEKGAGLLASSVEGIDIIIDSRTGLRLDEPAVISGTKICQAFKWGMFLGEIKLKFKDSKIIDFQYKLHPVNYKKDGELVGDPLENDEKVAKIIEKKTFNMDKIRKKPIAKMQKGKLDPTNVRKSETEIGNLICDAMLDYTNADIAFQNAGGIGEKIIKSKKLTRKSFDEIIKYDNSIVVLKITGEEIKKILQYSMANIGNGAFLQIGGISFEYKKSTGEISNIKTGKESLVDKKTYKVVINSWLAQGGDGYSIFPKISEKINFGMLHREILYDYVKNKKKISPHLDGRIKIIE